MTTQLEHLEDRLASAGDTATARVDALNALADYWSERDAVKLRQFADEALQVAASADYWAGMGEAYRGLIEAAYSSGDQPQGLALATKLLDLAQLHQLGFYEHKALNSIAHSHMHTGNFAGALQSYQAALKIAEQLDDTHACSCTLMNIGLVHGEVGDYDGALGYLQRSIELARGIGLKDWPMATRLYNLGYAYRYLGDLAQADHYNQQALATFEREGDVMGVVLALDLNGMILRDRGDLAESLAVYARCLELARQTHNVGLVGRIHFQIASVILKEGRATDAIAVLHEARQLLEQGGQKKDLMEAFELLATAHREIGDYEAAVSYFEGYHRLHQEIFHIEPTEDFKTLQIIYQIANTQLEKEVYRLKSESLERAIKTREQEEQQRITIAIERERVQALTNLFNGIYHDLMTPITIIRTSLHLLERLERDSARAVRSREVMHESLDHLTAKLQDMILMAHLDSDDPAFFAPAEISVADLILNALRSQQLPQSELHRIHTEPALPTLKIQVDRSLLTRALVNLVDNALRYSESAVRVSVTIDPDGVTLIVRDAGGGIPPEQLARLFERFYRGEAYRPVGTSSGLGLAMAKSIVEKHGGKITVESTLGVGSTFRIHLPAVPGTPAPRPSTPSRTNGGEEKSAS